MELRSSEEKKTLVVFDFEKAEIRFDRSQADGWSKGIAKSPLNLLGKDYLDIHIFSDQSSVEMFSNHYQNNISCNIFAPETACGNYITAQGGELSIEIMETWDLEGVM